MSRRSAADNRRHHFYAHGEHSLESSYRHRADLLIAYKREGWRNMHRIMPLTLLVLIGAAPAWPQGAAEYASITSAATAAIVRAKSSQEVNLFSPPKIKKKGTSPHLLIPTNLSAEAGTKPRRAEGTEEDMGSLLLRSVPKGAQIWIDGKLMGTTPLLLILAPDRYNIEVLGKRMEHVKKQVNLRANERQQLMFSPSPRYPRRVHLR